MNARWLAAISALIALTSCGEAPYYRVYSEIQTEEVAHSISMGAKMYIFPEEVDGATFEIIRISDGKRVTVAEHEIEKTVDEEHVFVAHFWTADFKGQNVLFVHRPNPGSKQPLVSLELKEDQILAGVQSSSSIRIRDYPFTVDRFMVRPHDAPEEVRRIHMMGFHHLEIDEMIEKTTKYPDLQFYVVRISRS